MSDRSGRKWTYLADILLMVAAQATTLYLVRYIMSRKDISSDPEAMHQEEIRRKSKANLRKLDGKAESDSASDDVGYRRPRKEELQLNQYEQVISTELIAPEDIAISFDDIGGHNDIIEELKESVIYPLTLPHLYSGSSSLLSAPSGVLLYGPPGCGKTMLAKALAHESGACFINLHISTLTEKWYGDSNKMVNAVFSLARKLQPTIVFIDEIDAVLGTRRSGEHEASGMVKAEFMTHWDGLMSANTSGEQQRIVILGATNRIQDIDEAILRRMPKKFPISLPSAYQRRRILRLILRDTKIDDTDFDEDLLVRVMAGMSGSDIKEACRDAAMVTVREFIKEKRERGELGTGINHEHIRGVRTSDFFGRRGGDQIIEANLQRQRNESTNQPADADESSDDEAEDDDEGRNLGSKY